MLNYDEFAQPIIHALNLKKSGNQYEGTCPSCGGKDRFRISNYHGELKHHCRKDCDLKDRTHALRNMGLLPEIKASVALPYHQQKNIPLIAASVEGGDVIIPISHVISGEKIGKQTIKPNGKKLFNKGMRKDGAGAFIGEPSDKLYVCEGWATAVAVHKATGHQALFALDAKTLVKTVKLIDHPDVVIAADNDAEGISAAKATGLPWAAPEATGADWWDVWNRGNIESFTKLADVAQASSMEADARLHPSFDFIGDIKITPTEWLIDEITAAHTFQSIVGASYSGKSLLAIDMACSVAAGIPFHGREVQQGTVAYICGEGRSGMLKRIDAWCASHFQELTKLPFILSANALNMRDTEMVQSIKKLANKVTDLRLIVIDTLNRNFGGGNENQSDAMGEFITACDQLIEHFDCTVCVVHHMGKDQSAGARGHSSFYAALDTEVTVKSIGDNDVQVSCTKQKDAHEFDAMQFIKVPTHESVVLDPVEVSKRSARVKLSDNQQIAMDTLYEGINPILATGTPKMSCRLHLEDWRNIFHRRHSGDNPKSKNTAFGRARNALQTSGLIVCENDYFTLGDRATGGDNV